MIDAPVAKTLIRRCVVIGTFAFNVKIVKRLRFTLNKALNTLSTLGSSSWHRTTSCCPRFAFSLSQPSLEFRNAAGCGRLAFKYCILLQLVGATAYYLESPSSNEAVQVGCVVQIIFALQMIFQCAWKPHGTLHYCHRQWIGHGH